MTLLTFITVGFRLINLPFLSKTFQADVTSIVDCPGMGTVIMTHP